MCFAVNIRTLETAGAFGRKLRLRSKGVLGMPLAGGVYTTSARAESSQTVGRQRWSFCVSLDMLLIGGSTRYADLSIARWHATFKRAVFFSRAFVHAVDIIYPPPAPELKRSHQVSLPA